METPMKEIKQLGSELKLAVGNIESNYLLIFKNDFEIKINNFNESTKSEIECIKSDFKRKLNNQDTQLNSVLE